MSPGPEGEQGRRVTRDVDPAALRDLLDSPPRATVAFVEAGCPVVLPARAELAGDRRVFAVAADAPPLDHREVVLVVDDGPYWFQLRGIAVRGSAIREEPTAAESGLVRYALDARRVLAWDYRAIREV